MSDEKSKAVREMRAIPRSDLIASSPLKIAVHNAIQKETLQEDFAEKVSYVYSENGLVHVPRTNTYIATDKKRILFGGTEDQIFKDFIEGSLLELFRLITNSDKRPVREVRIPRKNSKDDTPIFELNKLGLKIIIACRLYKNEWAISYVHHVFHPKVTVMLRAMRTYAGVIQAFSAPFNERTKEVRLVMALRRFVRFVRRVRKTWKFTNALNTHERQEQENFNSSRSLIYHYAEHYSKLLILRIDLYFKPYYSVELADKSINNFLRWLRGKACRRNLLPGYLCFLIKRENGLVRGMHWHLMVICNGNLQRNAGYLTHQLGEAWARRTGQGPGSYHNCYADRNRYLFNGLGLIEWDDLEKIAGLRAALWYMTKADCILKATNNKTKNFWRSPIPNRAWKKLGRPRASADSLRLIRRILGGKRSKYPPGFHPVQYTCCTVDVGVSEQST